MVTAGGADAEGATSALEHFSIESLLARGGMGCVYRGRDERTGQLVAIKQLTPASDDAVLAERLEREIQILRRLDHPNIVKILAWGVKDGKPHIVMEYVPGGSLREQLDREPRWGVARALRLLLELCDGLARVHHLGVIHRDIKPENVLLAADGSARLADFGLAKGEQLAEERLTATGAVPGTLAYLSPEALNGLELDGRVDVWGLGVLGFEVLAGERPFRGATAAQTLATILHRGPADLASLRPDLPPALVDLIGRMLEKDRAQRIASVRQVGAEMEALLKGLQLDPAGLGTQRSSRAPLASAPAPLGAGCPHNLPVDLTHFIGRQDELTALRQLVLAGPSRLVTLLGPGGIGKSRLALELCRRFTLEPNEVETPPGATFPDGVFLVELARIDAADQIVSAAAIAIGFPFRADVPVYPQLVGYLRTKRLLLLLDNFEHVLAGASVVCELLEAAPTVRVLATSRERLGVNAETQFVLDGLRVPAAQAEAAPFGFSALQLFVEAARRANPHFELGDEHIAHVTRVCSLVEGSPLGILLAASWMGTLSPAEIDAEMSRSLAFLEMDAADLPARHRSLHAVCEHSWRMLSGEQRAVFARLSVFRGGFTRAAASAVALADLRTLAGLVHKSLVRSRLGGMRYELHELLRQHAEAKLGEVSADYTATLDRHCSYFAEFLAAREQELRGPAQRAALHAIEAELANVHAAWRWILERGRLPELSRAIEALGSYYERKGSCAEAEALFRSAAAHLAPQASAQNPEAARLLGWILCLQAQCCQRQARSSEARQLVERALDILDAQAHPRERARALIMAAVVERGHANAKHVIGLGESGITLLRVSGERWLLAQALALVGPWLYEGGADVERADVCLRESIALQRELTGGVVLPLSLGNLGFGLVKQGRFAEGRELLQEALAIAEQIQDVWSLQMCLRLLAHTERSRGDYALAHELASRNLSLGERYGSQAEQSWASLALAEIEKDQGRLEQARVRLAACPLPPGTPDFFTALIELNLADIAQRCGQSARAEALLHSSLALFERLDIAWGVATALDILAALACDQGQPARSQQYFERALRVAWDLRRLPLVVHSAAGLARLQAQLGHPERAAEILAALAQHPSTEHATRRQRIEPLLTHLRSTLGAERLAQCLERGAALSIDSSLRGHLSPPHPPARSQT